MMSADELQSMCRICCSLHNDARQTEWLKAATKVSHYIVLDLGYSKRCVQNGLHFTAVGKGGTSREHIYEVTMSKGTSYKSLCDERKITVAIILYPAGIGTAKVTGKGIDIS